MKPLTDEDLSSIYKNIIKPGLFDKIKRSNHKTCVFLGGQPGSGKSYLNDITINTFENQSAVVIDSDLIRKHHPYIPLITEKDIYSLDADCYKWGEMLIKDSIKENKNVVFDGTFGGNITHTLQLLERFKENNYITKLNLLATNDIVSKIGFNWRYEYQKKLTGFARPVDMLYHNQVYERILENLNKTLPLNTIDEFNIYGRDHVTKRINLCHTYGIEELKVNHGKAITHYENERTRQFTAQEIKELSSWYSKTSRLIQENNGSLQMFQEAMQTYDTKASLQLKEQIKIITNTDVYKLNVSETKQLETIRSFETIKGNLGQNPIFQKSKNGYDVAAFSIGYKNEKNQTTWQNVQVWKNNIEKLKIHELKKGDFVELKGYYGKEYANKEGKVKKDFVLENCSVLKQVEKILESRNKGISTSLS